MLGVDKSVIVGYLATFRSIQIYPPRYASPPREKSRGVWRPGAQHDARSRHQTSKRIGYNYAAMIFSDRSIKEAIEGGRISFHEMTTPVEHPYGSKCQRQSEPTPSQMRQDFGGSQ